MATFRATFDFTRTAVGMLSFRSGDQFTVRNRTNADWWTVEDSKGEMGLVPVSYLEAMATPPVSEAETHIQPAQQNGVTSEEVYSALYDFTGQDSTQLTFKQGDKLWLVSKSDKSWWTMYSASGSSGLVPINYIDKIESRSPSVAHSDSGPHPQGSEPLSEVLLSIERAMQKIHDESVVHGGTYSSDQRTALQRLTAHRQSVLNGTQSTPSPTTQSHTSTPSPTHNSTTTTTTTTHPHHSHTSHTSHTLTSATKSPRPKRHAPPPPRNSPKSSPSKRDKRKSVPPRDQALPVREVLATEYESQTLPGRGEGKRRHRAKTQPRGMVDAREKSKSISQIDQGRAATVVVPGGGERGDQRGRSDTDRPVGLSSQRALSETFMNGGTGNQLAQSSQLLPVSRTSSVPGKACGRRYSAEPYTSPHHLPPQHSLPSSTSSSSSSPLMHRKAAPSDALPGDQKAQNSPRRVSSPRFSPMSSPAAQRRLRSNSSRSVVSLPEHPEQLPIHFSSSDGAEFVEVVRSRTNLSYVKSLQAVAGVLEVLKNKVPQCEAMVDGLLTAVQKSQGNYSPSTTQKLEKTHDMERLKEIFFQLQDVKEDSQQRGWAVHDDQRPIMEYLQELLQILCDADPQVSKSAVQEDKYENILILISYFDIESRTPIRLLLLQVFGVLCGLDREIINILLSSILPNELGRDIQDNVTEIEKTLYSSTVCTMIFSSGEPVSLSVYDQWSEKYISFLLDTIEAPPDEDTDDQVADAFLNVILSFNQHFQDPDSNLVMSALKQKSNPRNFSEKFMFLINRGEDPVVVQAPCSPDSLTKFALDIFSSKETSGMFYTTDLKVLIDIVLRQISDLSSGDEIRTHYLELLYRIIGSTDYTSHAHKRPEITAVLTRIAQEENAQSMSDQAIIRKMWLEHSGCFDEVTDL